MKRRITSHLHEDTLASLIQAYLNSINVINFNEEITHLTIGPPDSKGVLKLNYVLDKDVQLIEH